MTTLPALTVALLAFSTVPRGEVIEFGARWCPPCQQMSPILARLEREGLPVHSIDVDQQRELAERMNIEQLPTFLLVIDGKVVAQRVGMMAESELRGWVSQIPATVDPGVMLASHEQQSLPDTQLGAPRSSATPALMTEAPAAETEGRRSLLDLLPFGRREEEPPVIRASDALLAVNDAPSQAASLEADPLSASVRLRVDIDRTINLGSGTIVDSRPGRSLIVTCGHIFRGMNADTKVEVNVFRNGTFQSFVGTVLRYDLDSDVGLIAISTSNPVAAVPVSSGNVSPRRDDRVVSIGCSGGADPTVESLQITAVNKYVGPDNIECTGVPVQGRSGGGLFNDRGELVGICIASDEPAARGVYAGLYAVQDLLRDSGLAYLYQPAGNGAAQPLGSPAVDNTQLADNARGGAGQGAILGQPVGMPANTAQLAAAQSLAGPLNQPASPAPERSALVSTSGGVTAAGDWARLAEAAAGDAEIVVLVRPRNQPGAAARMVIINEASPKFFSFLNGELDQPAAALANNQAQPLPRTAEAMYSNPGLPAFLQNNAPQYNAPAYNATQLGSPQTSAPQYNVSQPPQAPVSEAPVWLRNATTPAANTRPANAALQPTSLTQLGGPQPYVRTGVTR